MTSQDLKNIIHEKGLTRLDILILILSVESNKPKQVKEIKDLAIQSGLRKINKWNISDILGRSAGLVIRTTAGWELSQSGKTRASALGTDNSPIANTSNQLRNLVSNIQNVETKKFLLETVKCLEAKYFRAAVVLSWVGAISLLYNYIIDNRLTDFNIEASRRNQKWKPAKSADDLGLMKEYDFLQILENLSVIGKNVKQELENCLKLRNSCGHPNSLKFGENRVAAHLEILILNVFSKF